MNWFLVVGENAGPVKPQAYDNADEAEAICRAKNYEYPALGPWEIVPVAEIRQAQPVSQTDDGVAHATSRSCAASRSSARFSLKAEILHYLESRK